MPNQKDRIILDTNILISFLLIKKSTEFDILISNNHVELLFSSELFTEFLSVTKRAKFKKYFDKVDIDNLITMLNIRAQFIEVNSEVSICRDTKDNFLLSLAKDGKATHLITGDKDLLTLKKFHKTKILTLSEYLFA